MGKFLSLLAGNEQDWKDAEQHDLDPGTYVFRVISHKVLGDADALLVSFKAEKPVDGSDFNHNRFSPVTLRFSERNEWQFLQFAKAVGLPLNNAEEHLSTVLGKLLKATVMHSENQRDPTRPFVNLRNLASYDPDAPIPGLAGAHAENEDGALD